MIKWYNLSFYSRLVALQTLRGRKEEQSIERKCEEKRREHGVTSGIVKVDKGKSNATFFPSSFLFTPARHRHNDYQNMTAARLHYKLMRTRRPWRCSAVQCACHSLTHSRRSTISTPLNALLKSTSSSSPSSSLTVVTHCVLVILFPVCNERFRRGGGGDDSSDRQAGRKCVSGSHFDFMKVDVQRNEVIQHKKENGECKAIFTPYVCRGWKKRRALWSRATSALLWLDPRGVLIEGRGGGRGGREVIGEEERWYGRKRRRVRIRQ